MSHFHIIHFNDVYNVNPVTEKQEPLGGLTRFQTVVKQIRDLCGDKEPLVLFSGDLLSPSLYSALTQGRHMLKALRYIGVHVACLGNHELDFSIEHAARLLNEDETVWLLSNIYDNETGEPLCGLPTTHVLDWQGTRIGFIGVVQDWMSAVPSPPEHGVTYHDWVSTATKLASKLRSEENVDYVIVLSHSRLADDQRLIEEGEGIDLVLGGHDHFYHTEQSDSGTILCKSAMDFRWMSWLTVTRSGRIPSVQSRLPFSITPHSLARSDTDGTETELVEYVNGATNVTILKISVIKEIVPDPEVSAWLTELSEKIESQMSHYVGSISKPLDARHSTARTGESPAGDLICDIVRRTYHCDAVIINGGCIRAGTILPAGDMTFRDVLGLFPFMDPTVVVEMTGKQLWKTINYGFHKFPTHWGGFPQVSGLLVEFDDEVEEGVSNDPHDIQGIRNRLRELRIQVYGQSIWTRITPDDPDDVTYRIGTRGQMYDKMDGYDEFAKSPVHVDDGLTFSLLLRNFFWRIESLNRMHEFSENEPTEVSDFQPISRNSRSLSQQLRSIPMIEIDETVDEKESPIAQVIPECDGRMVTCTQRRELGDSYWGTNGLHRKLERLPSFGALDHQPRRSTIEKMKQDWITIWDEEMEEWLILPSTKKLPAKNRGSVVLTSDDLPAQQ